MELKYIILTIIKILISVPTILMMVSSVDASALMGGHFDNSNNSNLTNLTSSYDFKIDLGEGESQEINTSATNETAESSSISLMEKSEEIPDPSALVVPGYNLPESIFNKGKPFYLEKDPLTGNIDFNSKTPSLQMYDEEYEYVDDEPAEYNIHDKANINRKDGPISGSHHKPSDINQLTPNFHDFLNLPVKYNPDKYVYPLISSSYANTKVQGNVNNKIHNHKEYAVTTYKPTYNPTYYTTKSYFGTTKLFITTTPKYTTTTPSPRKPEMYLTTNDKNLMHSAMNHPSFTEDYYNSNSNSNSNSKTPQSTTQVVAQSTKRPMSLFEQLFGDFEEETTTTTVPEPISTSTMKYEVYNGNKITNGHQSNENLNVLTGSNMEHESAYEYEDEYPNSNVSDNIMVESKPVDNRIETTTNKIMTTISTTMRNTYQVPEVDFQEGEDVIDFDFTKTETTTVSPNKVMTTRKVVTSLPLGENHVTHKQPIIVATQNLRESLNHEKVDPAKPFSKNPGVVLKQVPSTSNIHIAPDQDTVSFVVGHYQNVEGSSSGGQYTGKESPYDSNPFRPVYGVVAPSEIGPNSAGSGGGYQVQVQDNEELYYHHQKYPEEMLISGEDTEVGSRVTIQPVKNSEASLAIGVPLNNIQIKPGQVVDDLISPETIEFPKGTGPKIVFPDATTYQPHLVPPLPPVTHQVLPNREVLQLNSKPMFHQLPSELTPPLEREAPPAMAPPLPSRPDRVRPPWDPRPGHFHSGRPEYARPPRPPPNSNEIYKRIDNLPNILPQFRPNNGGGGHHYNRPQPHHHHHPMVDHHIKNYARQPLLDRPSNRPIGFFEKLQPPPPPKNLQVLRKVPALENELILRQQAEDRVINVKKQQLQEPLFGFLNAPPKVVLANRRNGLLDVPEVETLQMIQAKHADQKNKLLEENKDSGSKTTVVKANMSGKDTLEKPLYVVYPVNTPPLKLDAIDGNKKESVVIGTRAELPLPPSKINNAPESFVATQEFNFKQNDRHDSPILKPHPRPSNYPIKSDFPYPLERPDPSIMNLPNAPSEISGGGGGSDNLLLDNSHSNKLQLSDETNFVLSNQWNTIEDVETEARIVNVPNPNNQISATLKTYTAEKPIAVAYTPTEPPLSYDKYSPPNYASLVIPEIRPSEDAGDDSEFTVGAIMHTHTQQANSASVDPATENLAFINRNKQKIQEKIALAAAIAAAKADAEESTNNNIRVIPQQDFQAPFQASANVDSSLSQGWSVINRSKDVVGGGKEEEGVEVAGGVSGGSTVIPGVVTTKEFDIENFKPQLEGGFKPIYSYPDEAGKEMQVNERQE